MKKLLSLIFAISLTLSACGTEQTKITPPAQTPITPLPIIPTFTPTIDVSTIITVVPAEKAECPKVDYTIPFDNGFKKIDTCFKTAVQDNLYPVACLNKNLHNEILDYLNSGGDIRKIITILDDYEYGENYLYVYKDLTGDRTPEFLLRDTFRFSYSGGYFFYQCSSGSYTIINDADQEPGIIIQSIQDKNLNGIPEIMFLIRNTPVIIEWNGNSFVKIGN